MVNWLPGDRDQHGSNALIGVVVCMGLLQIAFVGARFYTRAWQRTKIKLDDYVVLLAMLATLAKAVLYIYLAKVFTPASADEASIASFLFTLRKCVFVIEILDFPLSVTPAKLALLIFYARIFDIRRFRMCAYAIGTVVLAVGLAALFATFFQCRPFQYIWDPTIPGGKCVAWSNFYSVLSPLNVFNGVVIVSLPLLEIWKLNAPRAKKVHLTGVFLFGGLGTVASTVSMAIFFATKDKASNDPALGFSSEIAILVVVENTLTIIASCFASIWPLLTNFMQWLQLSASRSQPKTPGQYLHLQESPKPNKSTDSTAPCNEGQVSPEGKSWYSEASRGSLVLDLESQKPPHA